MTAPAKPTHSRSRSQWWKNTGSPIPNSARDYTRNASPQWDHGAPIRLFRPDHHRTGGISALLLGRMRMTVDDMAKEFMSSAKTAFKPSFTSLSRIRPEQIILGRSALDSIIGDIANQCLRASDRDAPLYNFSTDSGISTLKVSADSPPHVFRPYSTAQPPSQFAMREVACLCRDRANILPSETRKSTCRIHRCWASRLQ